MIYNIDTEVELNFDFDYETTFKNVVNSVLEHFSCPYDCEVSLLLVDDNSIKNINNETRGIDKPTDVLSFPNIQFDVAGNFENVDENDDIFEPDTGELILGDIVISIERIEEQAKEYGHSLLREYSFLICHSMLHLIGFDHIEDADREIMEEYQSKIMNILGIMR